MDEEGRIDVSRLKAYLRRISWINAASFLASFGLFIALYLIISYIAKSEFIPYYPELYHWFLRYVREGWLQSSIIISVQRWIKGYIAGSIVGIMIGIVMGLSRKIEEILTIPVVIFRFTPAFAFTSLFCLLFGATEFSRFLLIFMAVTMITIVFTYHGVRDIPAKYIEAAQVLGASNLKMLRKVILQAALPHIFDGLRVGIAAGWTTIIASEILAATDGLGYLLITGRQFANVAVLFIALATIGVIVSITDIIFLSVRRYVLRWMA